MGHQRYQHISFDEVEQFVPRVPEQRAPKEDSRIPRICMTDSVLKALRSMPQTGEFLELVKFMNLTPIIYVYEIPQNRVEEIAVNKIFERREGKYPVLCNEATQQFVPDALYSGEKWLLVSPNMKDVRRKKYHIVKYSIQKRLDMYSNKYMWIKEIEMEETKCHHDLGQQFMNMIDINHHMDFTTILKKYGIVRTLLTIKDNIINKNIVNI